VSTKRSASLDNAIIEVLRASALASPRQGDRKAYRAVREAGYQVNLKRVARLWREAGLRVPSRRTRRRQPRPGVPMGAHLPIRANVTWALDFQFDATSEPRVTKVLNVVDAYTREYLACVVGRSIDARDVVATLDGLVAERGGPSVPSRQRPGVRKQVPWRTHQPNSG